MPRRKAGEDNGAQTPLNILRTTHADDDTVSAMLKRISAAPELWKGGPAELRGREAEIIAWLIDALHKFRQLNGEWPRNADKRLMQRWRKTLDGPGVTPGFIADQLKLVLLMSDTMWATVMAELAAEGGREWYGEPEILPERVHKAFGAILEVHGLFSRLEEKRQAKLKSLPAIGRRGGPETRERFVTRYLSARIKAECGQPCDKFVDRFAAIAFGRRLDLDLTAERVRDRRRRNR